MNDMPHDLAPTQAMKDIQADLLLIRAHMKQGADGLRAFLLSDDEPRRGELTALCNDMFRRRESVSQLCRRNEQMFALAESALLDLVRAVAHRPDSDAGARTVRTECRELIRGLHATRKMMRESERELALQCECVFDVAFRFDTGSDTAEAVARRLRDILR